MPAVEPFWWNGMDGAPGRNRTRNLVVCLRPSDGHSFDQPGCEKDEVVAKGCQ